MRHFWVKATDPVGETPDMEGIVSEDELKSLLRCGMELRSCMGAIKADIVEEVSNAVS